MNADDSTPDEYFLLSRIENGELPNGKHVRIVTEELDDAVNIRNIVRMMKKLIRTDVLPSFQVRERLGAFRVIGGLPWFEIFLARADLTLKERYPYHVLHPLAETFFDVVPKLSTGGRDVQDYSGKLIYKYVERLNSVAQELRAEAQRINWQAAERNFRRGAAKNRNSLINLFNALSDKYSKLLVVRVDLGYTSGQGMELSANRPFFAITMRHQAELRALLKKHFAKNYVGYAIKVEYGLLKGYHHHAFFFFDGNKLHGDVSIGRWIGDAWNWSINEGRGVYFNCNAHKASYRHCGIGMGRWYDLDFVRSFEMAANYITKPDEFMQIRKSRLGRTYCRSIVPRPSDVRRGRRRGFS